MAEDDRPDRTRPTHTVTARGDAASGERDPVTDEEPATGSSGSRCCFSIRLREGMGPVYDRLHREMPPEVVASLRRVGFRSLTMFRHANAAVGCAEVDGPLDEAFRQLESDGSFAAWALRFEGVFSEATEGGVAQVQQLDEVWRLG